MIIKHIHVYGFGKWQDYQLTLPESKLVIVYGENEAGKSTLRNFLLFVLFGLSSKKRELYRPKTGGVIGGRIKVWTEKDGFFIIERVQEKNNGKAVCHLADGNERDEEWLKERLQKIDEKMYHSIFSFSADDLNYLHRISGEEIGEVLLGMGMAGTSAIYQAEKKLDQKLEERFKPLGKNPVINQQINKLERMEKQLHEKEKEEKQYQNKKQAELALLTEIAEKQTDMEKEEQRKRTLEQKMQALPLVIEYFSVQKILPEIEEVYPFPEQGIDRYGELKQAVLPLESERTVLLNSKQDDLKRLKTNEKQLADEKQLDEMENWEKELEDCKRKSDFIHYQSKELTDLQTKIGLELDLLNIGIDFEELQDITLPFYIEDKWNNWNQEKQMLEKELIAIAGKESEIQKELSQLQDKKEELETKLPDTSSPDESIESRQVTKDKQTGQRKGKKTEKAWPPANLLSGIGITISLLLLLVSINYSIGWLTVLAALFPAFITGRWIWQLQSNKTQYHSSGDAEAERDAAFNWKLQNVQEQIQKCNLELLKIAEKRKFFEGQAAAIKTGISEERELYPFLVNIEVEQWPKLYGALNQIFYKYKQFTSLEHSCRQLETDQIAFRDKTALLLGKYKNNLSPGDKDNPIEAMEKNIAEQRRLRTLVKDLQEKIEQTESAIQVCKQKIAPYQSEMLNLLKAAKVEKEEEFYAKGKKKAQFEEHCKKTDALILQLKALLSTKEVEEILHQPLPAHWELEQEKDKRKEQVKKLQAEVETARQELSDLRTSLAKMEDSGLLSELRHQFEQEKEVLRKQSMEWARYRLAKAALLETKKEYREKYFPAVMDIASDIFSVITSNRYSSVRLTEENSLLIQHQNGFGFKVQELSKGTHDQLYLALKIALSELTNRHNPLPFLIDDAFVHFDTERLRKIPDILKKTTSSNQILWFTCNSAFTINGEDWEYIHLQKNKPNSVTML